jgi:hypothetical protein
VLSLTIPVSAIATKIPNGMSLRRIILTSVSSGPHEGTKHKMILHGRVAHSNQNNGNLLRL